MRLINQLNTTDIAQLHEVPNMEKGPVYPGLISEQAWQHAIDHIEHAFGSDTWSFWETAVQVHRVDPQRLPKIVFSAGCKAYTVGRINEYSDFAEVISHARMLSNMNEILQISTPGLETLGRLTNDLKHYINRNYISAREAVEAAFFLQTFLNDQPYWQLLPEFVQQSTEQFLATGATSDDEASIANHAKLLAHCCVLEPERYTEYQVLKLLGHNSVYEAYLAAAKLPNALEVSAWLRIIFAKNITIANGSMQLETNDNSVIKDLPQVLVI